MGIIDRLKQLWEVSDPEVGEKINQALNQEHNSHILNDIPPEDPPSSYYTQLQRRDKLLLEIESIKKQINRIDSLGKSHQIGKLQAVFGNKAFDLAKLMAKEGSKEKATIDKLKEINSHFDVSDRVAELNIQLITENLNSGKRLELENELRHLNRKGNVGEVYWLFRDVFGLSSTEINQKIKDKILSGWLEKVFSSFDDSFNLGQIFERSIIIKDIDHYELILSRLKSLNIEKTIQALKDKSKKTRLSDKISEAIKERLTNVYKEYDPILETLYQSYSYELLNMMYNTVQLDLDSIMKSIDAKYILNEIFQVHIDFFNNENPA